MLRKRRPENACISVSILIFLAAGSTFAADAEPAQSADPQPVLVNAAFRLSAAIGAGAVRLRLEDLRSGVCAADGPCIYSATTQNCRADRLDDPSIIVDGAMLTIRGKLSGLDVEHRFTALEDRPILEERIILRNNTSGTIALSELEVGMQRRAADSQGAVLPELAADRLAAVPFLHRATDPKGRKHEYSIQEIVGQSGGEPRMAEPRNSGHWVSEGWAWTRGKHVLGIFKFCQEHLQFSVISKRSAADGVHLRIGGAAMISGEPADLGRMAPGAAVDLGVTRYETLEGGHAEACYAFRAMLDEMGCRFPLDFNPPVHWEQLYDMFGAWQDRPNRYTKAILEQEAAKGKVFHCEALYLDPGWDTDFGTFLWGEKWLGPCKQFIDEMQSKYGLKVSLHCPLATWMSSAGAWGNDPVLTYPLESRRIPPGAGAVAPMTVPAARNGRRNLALLGAAKANASSVIAGGANPNQQIAHLNDGWYGNSASWIPNKMPAWAEIDLGAIHSIAEVRVGNDRTGGYVERAPTNLRILTATEYDASSNATAWREVARYSGEGIVGTETFTFSPIAARWVRVEILKAKGGPRLDEIEVYEAAKLAESDITAFEKQAKRRPKPNPSFTVCLGSKQYLAAAEERLSDLCANGIVFLMFDGNKWNQGCVNPDHGHAVPYQWEDHIRANVELARRIHAKHPIVLIEMHDMIAGGAAWRPTPIYYKYGLPGSYDENWGFELMWNPMADIVQGRAAALYYANLGSNVPIYTHVTLKTDNAHCIVLWWYASTCRHLGIGGTHKDPAVVKAQQEAMRWYRANDRFFKRGDFYGVSEEIHLHALPEENAFTVNVFNLSDEDKNIVGDIDLRQLGLNPGLNYSATDGCGTVENGCYRIRVQLPPWGTKVGKVEAPRQ